MTAGSLSLAPLRRLPPGQGAPSLQQHHLGAGFVQEFAQAHVQIDRERHAHMAVGDVVPGATPHQDRASIPFQFDKLSKERRSAIDARVEIGNHRYPRLVCDRNDLPFFPLRQDAALALKTMGLSP